MLLSCDTGREPLLCLETTGVSVWVGQQAGSANMKRRHTCSTGHTRPVNYETLFHPVWQQDCSHDHQNCTSTRPITHQLASKLSNVLDFTFIIHLSTINWFSLCSCWLSMVDRLNSVQLSIQSISIKPNLTESCSKMKLYKSKLYIKLFRTIHEGFGILPGENRFLKWWASYNLTLQGTLQTKEMIVCLGWTRICCSLEYNCLILLIYTRTKVFPIRDKTFWGYSVSALWSNCPQGVKYYAYTHAHIYVSCLLFCRLKCDPVLNQLQSCTDSSVSDAFSPAVTRLWQNPRAVWWSDNQVTKSGSFVPSC